MGKSSKKSSGKDAAPTKCICPEPFVCSCGNRPPRPSKGHKWYPETQEWAGKGHKQKGASGQVSSVAAAAVTTSVGKTTVESWQRLPSALLEEYIRKQKRPQAKYKNIDTSLNTSKFRYRVILPDSKNSDKDLIFCPQQPVANQEQAKEEAALLALLSLTPNLPHERKLPEPYKQTWLFAREAQTRKKEAQEPIASIESMANNNNNCPPSIATNAASTTAAQASTLLAASVPTFASRADRRQQEQQRRQERNQRIRHHEAVRLANRPQQVFMSAMVRRQIEALLRGDVVQHQLDGDEPDDEDENDDDNPAIDSTFRDLRAYVVKRLVSEGFMMRQAKTAFQQACNSSATVGKEDEWDAVYEESLQWLLVHLNEDQLPEGFDPQEGMLDVIVAPNAAAPQEHGSLAELYSLDREDAAYLVAQAANSMLGIDTTFWNLVVETSHVKLGSQQVDREMTATNMELLDSEIDAIRSIYDSACSVDKGDVDTSISVQIADTHLSLNVVVRNGYYPSEWPTRATISGNWATGRPIGVALHASLIRFMAENLQLGDFMLLEVLGQTQGLLQNIDDLPDMGLRPALAMKKALKTSRPVEESMATMHCAALASTAHRSRERSKFWSVPPKDTPPAASSPRISQLLERARESLPAAAARTEFLAKLAACVWTGNVMLVTGATGCGKTTQICQFILEANPKDAKIVIAQPRRLAATGVAARVAEERGEQRPGMESVGYVVRGDSAICDRTRLLFCTTGILLRQLQNESALDCITHILIDECHERSLDSDILLGLLRQVKSSYPNLKIILMSATIDAERMAAYWGKHTPTIDIPGRTFPVTDYTLEDVFALTHSTDPAVISDLCKQATKTLDYDLMGRLIKSLILRREKNDDGSILVFLPGAPEIAKATEAIKRRTDEMTVLLLQLHGGLQPKDQNVVFRAAPFGSIKVILSTNIAETSVTIPDCTVVIDTCREKQSSYDPSNRMPLLVEQYASRASLKQRRGRAGRVRPGVCYKLITQGTLDGLAEHTEPEIKRCAFDQTLLSLLFLGVEDGTGSFTRTLLDPPSDASLTAASESLRMIGAIVESDMDQGTLRLTPLGKHLAGIPAPPIIGKRKSPCVLQAASNPLACLSIGTWSLTTFYSASHGINTGLSLCCHRNGCGFEFRSKPFFEHCTTSSYQTATGRVRRIP